MTAEVEKFSKASKQWQKEMNKLRDIIQKTNLDEEFKWRLPCYTHSGKNIVIIQPFKDFLGLMFFKGSLLKDPKGVLSEIGPNSKICRRLELSSLAEITKLAPVIKSFIKEAIAIEESGEAVKTKTTPEAIPEELQKMFTKKPQLKKAFYSLTPGRQRGYLIYFSGAKQSSTRQARIEKYIPYILKGKGFHDR